MRNGHLLVEEGEDTVKGSSYVRAIGGGIDFGETAEIALRREFREELGLELIDVWLLGVVENFFEYEGRPGHQIAHVFAVESTDIDSIALDAQLHILDEGSPVRWINIEQLNKPLYPEGADALLQVWLESSKPRRT
ncbi:NUDIX hydrolase [Glutamicibacter sp. AOP5-B1-3]